jgi:hypothetical protein
MKHNLKIKDVFNKKEKIGFIINFLLFFSLGGYLTLLSPASGLLVIILGFAPPGFLFLKRSKDNFMEVIRITSKDNVTRINFESWDKKEVLNLSRNYFWTKGNKLIAIGTDFDNEFKPIYPFNRDLPSITSGQIKRSGVQEVADDLMVSEKSNIKEAVVLGGIFILAAILLFINYAMFNRILESL